jgi:hypothetical protein
MHHHTWIWKTFFYLSVSSYESHRKERNKPLILQGRIEIVHLDGDNILQILTDALKPTFKSCFLAGFQPQGLNGETHGLGKQQVSSI